MLKKISIHSINRPFKGDLGSSRHQRLNSVLHKSLSDLLADTYGLYQQCLYYYSNVASIDHLGLDELFEKQCELLRGMGAQIAERLRAIGYPTAEQPGHLYLPSFPNNRTAVTSIHEMLKNVVKGHETCSKKALHSLELAENAEDQKTASLLLQAMIMHDKSIWMINALCA